VIGRKRILQHDRRATCGAFRCGEWTTNQCSRLTPEISLRGRYERVSDNFVEPRIRKETAHAITEQRRAWPMWWEIGARN
jgi:hypothetical protein